MLRVTSVAMCMNSLQVEAHLIYIERCKQTVFCCIVDGEEMDEILGDRRICEINELEQ